MKGLPSLPSRATPALRNLSRDSFNFRKFDRENAQILKPSTSFNHIPTNNSDAPSKGNSISLNSKSESTSFVSPSKTTPNSTRKVFKNIDHSYLSRVLSRSDWFLLLNHEFKAKRISLSPQFAASVLQNQENPLNNLKFYIWVSNVEPVISNSQSIRNVLGNTLYRKGPVLLSAELIKDIKSLSCGFTEELLCILVGSWGRLGLANYCNEIFGQISFMGITPSTRLYNAVIDALVKSKSLDLAYLKFQQMSTDNCKPDRFTYNILIHGVCKIGVVDEALRLLKQMEGLGYKPNVFTYTILIDGFCNAKRVDEAFKVLKTMKQMNVSPNEATIRSLVNGVFRSVAPVNAFDLLIKFMDEEPKMKKLGCDTLLCSLSNNSMAKEAASFLRKIGEGSYLPESSTFNVAMLCLIKELDLSETCDVLDKFIERGMKPSFGTYLVLIEALYKNRKCEEGDRYLNQMEKDGLVSNVFSYNMVIDCFCKANMVNRAAKTFERMRQKGIAPIAPNLVTFNTLMSGYCKEGNLFHVRELLELLLKSGLKPDVFTFSSLIQCLCRAHQIEDALDCLTEMVEWGVTPNSITYNIIIRALCVLGDVGRAVKLLRRLKEDGWSPDIYSFNALIQSFCRMNNVDKAEKLFASMLTFGLNPDNYTYSALIKALCESGRVVEAKKMFLSMEAKGCVPDSYSCNLIVKHLVRVAKFDEAENIVKRFNKKGIHVKPVSVL